MQDFASAIETFVRGFAFTRSFTHPYEVERVGKMWVLRDAPRRSGTYRTQEWVAHGVSPAEADRVIRRESGGKGRFAISIILGNAENPEKLRDAYKALGYRLRTSEFFMVHDLRRILSHAPPAGISIERVVDRPTAESLAKAARGRQILPEHLAEDAPIRQYVAEHAGQLVGWVRSIRVELRGQITTWCSNMYVTPAHRRKGIARAMLCRLLRDDRSSGAEMAVLLSSHTGAKLYPHVGYEQIGKLLLFGPAK